MRDAATPDTSIRSSAMVLAVLTKPRDGCHGHLVRVLPNLGEVASLKRTTGKAGMAVLPHENPRPLHNRAERPRLARAAPRRPPTAKSAASASAARLWELSKQALGAPLPV
ncbi:MAG TPA: hypothetical protein VFZ70_04150 [Euzebyales bacterium]